MTDARARIAAVGLSAAVFVLGLLYSYLYLGRRLIYFEESNYLGLARNMARHFSYSLDGVTSTAWWPPGYPIALVAPIWAGADVPTLRLVNFAALALSIYLMYAMVRNVASPGAGVLAGVLVVAYPVLFYAAGTFFQTPLACFLFVAILYRLSRPDGLTRGPLVVTGLIFGYLILTVPSFVFQLVVVAAWLAWAKPEGRVQAVLAVVVPALLVVSVWSARTYPLYNRFVFVSSNGGINLFIGNSAEASPNAAPNTPGLEELARSLVARGMNEVEADHELRRRALNFIVDNKAQALKLYLLKNLNYFNIRNELYAASEMSVLRDVVMLLTYGPLLVVFLLRLGLVKRFPVWRFEGLLLLLYVTNIPFAALFITRVRYRLPFDFLMIAVAAMFLSRSLGTRR